MIWFYIIGMMISLGMQAAFNNKIGASIFNIVFWPICCGMMIAVIFRKII